MTKLTVKAIKNILEAALMTAGHPMSVEQMAGLFDEAERPKPAAITKIMKSLMSDYQGRGIELIEVASGYRFQARPEYAIWVGRLWEEKPQRYSRALLETLALIAYQQPITRSEIEDVRGVSVSTNIIKTLLERDWVRVVGHKDVPGKPALYATTKAFLDYFNLKSLEQLPSLMDVRNLDEIEKELEQQLLDLEQPNDLETTQKENAASNSETGE
jgi:segregation and condensation protein B|tara:strand:- start:1993 stop:2637 length:645 start_codon:yes stop_codon:yes gene_type:complete